MHRDFMNKKANTELEALTGFVVHEAKKKGLSTPIFDKIYQKLANQ